VSATGQPIPDGFWSPAHPEFILQIWEEQAALGKEYDNRSKTILFISRMATNRGKRGNKTENY